MSVFPSFCFFCLFARFLSFFLTFLIFIFISIQRAVNSFLLISHAFSFFIAFVSSIQMKRVKMFLSLFQSLCAALDTLYSPIQRKEPKSEKKSPVASCNAWVWALSLVPMHRVVRWICFCINKTFKCLRSKRNSFLSVMASHQFHCSLFIFRFQYFLVLCECN